MADWRAVADVMAERLRWAACSDHNPPDPGCPYCQDVAAFEAYAAAGGTVRRWEPKGRVVDVDVPVCTRCGKRAPWCSCPGGPNYA